MDGTETQNLGQNISPFLLADMVKIVMKRKALSFYDALFYVTSSEMYANLRKEETKLWYLSCMALYDILEVVQKISRFDGATKEWLDFVVNNRKGIKPDAYDLVMGPVADDKLYTTIQLYENKAITAEAAIEMLNTHVLFDQLSFHSVETTLFCNLSKR